MFNSGNSMRVADAQPQFDFWQWYQMQLMLNQLNDPMSQIAAQNARMPQELQLDDSTGRKEQQQAQAEYMAMVKPQIDAAQAQALQDQPFGGGNTFAGARSGQIAADAGRGAYSAGLDAKNNAVDRVSRARASYLGVPYQDMNNGSVQSKLVDNAMKQPSNMGGDIMSLVRGAYNFASPYVPKVAQTIQKQGLIPAATNVARQIPGDIRNLLWGSN